MTILLPPSQWMTKAPGIGFTLLPGCRCRASSGMVLVHPDAWPVLSTGPWHPSLVAAHRSGQRAPLKQQGEGWWDSGQQQQLISIHRSQQIGICSQTTRGSACECSCCECTLTPSVLYTDAPNLPDPVSRAESDGEPPENTEALSSAQLVYTSDYSTLGEFHLVEFYYHCGKFLRNSFLVGF